MARRKSQFAQGSRRRKRHPSVRRLVRPLHRWLQRLRLPAPPNAHRRGGTARGAPAPLPPTLDDVARLTHACDYSCFVAPDVNAYVKDSALKKFFTDPLCNAIDGLGAHIDDYGKPDPIPLEMLRRMELSKFLGLFDDDPNQGQLPTDPGRVIAGGPSTDEATPLPATNDPANVAPALHGPVAATLKSSGPRSRETAACRATPLPSPGRLACNRLTKAVNDDLGQTITVIRSSETLKAPYSV